MSDYDFFLLGQTLGYSLTSAVIYSIIPLIISIFKKRFKVGLLIFVLSAITVNIHHYAPLLIAINGTIILFQNKHTIDSSTTQSTSNLPETTENTFT